MIEPPWWACSKSRSAVWLQRCSEPMRITTWLWTRIRVTSKYGVIVKLWRMRTLKTRTCRFLWAKPGRLTLRTRWERKWRMRWTLRSSAAVLFWTCARHWLPRFWNWKKTVFTINTLIRWVLLSMQRFTRFGKRKCCCSMTKAMNCCCPRPNRFRATSTVRVRLPAPW